MTHTSDTSATNDKGIVLTHDERVVINLLRQYRGAPPLPGSHPNESPVHCMERADAIDEALSDIRADEKDELLAARREVEAARAALNGIADHGWCYDGRVTFTINCVGMGDAKRLEALLTAALAATPEEKK